jgi:hypothetical protein
MSAKVVSFIFEHSKTVGSARVLMLAIADMANNDGECWPGRANLARRVNVSVRQITRLIQECERTGELSVISERRPNNEFENNRYLIHGVAADQRITKARQPKPKAERKDTRVTSDTDDTTGSDTDVTLTKSAEPKALKRLSDASAPNVSVLPKAGSYQARTGKTDAECEAERIALAEQQRLIDERRLIENGHIAQLEIDVKHYIPGLGGSLGKKYARMLYGRLSTKGKKSKPEDNAYLEQSALLRDAPVTPNEFTAWADEYCKERGIKPGDYTMLKAPEKLVSSILARRERLAAGTSTNASNFGATNWDNDFWDKFDGKVGA